MKLLTHTTSNLFSFFLCHCCWVAELILAAAEKMNSPKGNATTADEEVEADTTRTKTETKNPEEPEAFIPFYLALDGCSLHVVRLPLFAKDGFVLMGGVGRYWDIEQKMKEGIGDRFFIEKLADGKLKKFPSNEIDKFEAENQETDAIALWV